MKFRRSITGIGRCCGAAALALGLCACMRVHMDPVEVKPITLNVNIKYVDDKLDDFYAFQKKDERVPATQPTTRSVSDAAAVNAGYKP